MTRYVRSGGIWVPATRKVRVGGEWVNVDVPPPDEVFVREFDGVDDVVECSIGTLGVSENTTGITVLSVWKPLAVEPGGIIRAYDSTTDTTAWGINQYSDNNVYYSAGGFFSQGPYSGSDGWLISGFSDPMFTGTDNARAHWYSFNGASWTHADGPNSLGSNTVPDRLRFGRNTGSEFGPIRLAVSGVWLHQLSTVQVETVTTGVAAWEALSPDMLLVWNQSDVTQSVVDRTGNGADQISRVGTTVVSSDAPSGFTF